MNGHEACVAYADILGFKYRVNSRRNLQDLSACLRGFLNGEELRREADRYEIDYAIFSDSILAVARDKGDEKEYEELGNMVNFCSQLLSQSIYARLPVRGAISWGPVYWDKEIKIGPAINEAVAWEARQHWVGIMLTPSAICYMNEHLACRDRVMPMLFPQDEKLLPLKRTPTVTVKGCAVRPYMPDVEHCNTLINILKELAIESCNPDVQEKYDRTAQVLALELDRLELQST